MIQELIVGASNQYELTVRGRPQTWTDEVWGKVYGFPKKGSGLASRTDKFTAGKFRNAAHSKEGYAISDCLDARQRQILEFLIPILYPEKPTRVTVTVANTIFGAFEGRPVNWGKVIGSVVAKLAANVGKGKTSPIGPYLFHLYHHAELLSDAEMVEYNTGATILQYGLTEEVRAEEPPEEEEEEPEEEEQPLERRHRKSTDPASRGKLPVQQKITEEEEGSMSGFFKTGFNWVLQAQEYHDSLVDLLRRISRELKTDPEDILETLKKLPHPEVLEKKDKQIATLEKEKIDLQARLSWAQGEMTVAKQREKEALQLLKNLSGLVDKPADMVMKAALTQSRLTEEGHLTGSKVIRILVDFSSRMETTLKEMRQLLGRIDPDRVMDFSNFPEIHFDTETPVKLSASMPLPPKPEAPIESLRYSTEPFSKQLEKTIRGSVKSAPVPVTQPDVRRELAPPEITVSPPVPVVQLPEKEPQQTPRVQREVELSERIGGLLNPARSHPEEFEHMAEEQQPRKEIEPIVLDETSLGEEIERDVTQIDKSEEEEYRTGSEDEEEEGDYSPPEFRKIQTRAALRMTPAKATPKPTPKSISRAPASQGGSSQKKARKGK
jgi:hypothetical protein